MQKTIAVVMIDGVADWEIGPVLPAAREWFGAGITIASVDGAPVNSIGGLRIHPETSLAQLPVDEADLWILPGSEQWQTAALPGLEAALRQRIAAGRGVAAICGATLAAARAGLLDHRAHTSNSRNFLERHVPGYAGQAHYRDQRTVVADGLVTAPGTSPVSFAVECLRLLYPEREPDIARARAMFAGEFADG